LLQARLLHLSAIDLVIIILYFAAASASASTSRLTKTGEESSSRTRDDGLDRGPFLPRRDLGSLELMGLGRQRVPVRHPRHALLLDRRHPSDAVPAL